MDTLAGFQSLRNTMERCSEIVAHAYAAKPEQLLQFQGELPPKHKAGHRRHRYWVTELDGDLVVSLPGTTHPMDWSSNMSVHYVPIDGSHPTADTPTEQLEKVPCAHAGFYFRAETIPTLALLEQAAAKGLRLVLTGHSLGAAVANICTLTALTAQKKAREAAANAAVAKHTAAAAAAAEAQHTSTTTSTTSSTTAKQKHKKPNPFRAAATAAVVAAAEAHTNHSWCSAHSDITVSPQAALVDVVCVAFASPHWANQALADHIEENDWGEVFVNVVVPEDYCLNLFNNVLTSANTAERYTLSRTNSKASMLESSSVTRLADEPEAETCCPDPLGLFTPADSMPDSLAGMSSDSSTATASSAGVSSTSTSNNSSGGAGCPPARYSYQPGVQQPLVSALAGTRRKQKKQQLSFALPADQKAPLPAASAAVAVAAVAAASGTPAVAAAAVVEELPRPPAVSVTCSQPAGMPAGLFVDTGSWSEFRDVLPGSPSCASLSSLSSLNSTRSWTLMAYLPEVLIRTFSNTSSASSSGDGDASNSSSRASSDGGCPDAAADAIAAMFAGPDVARASIPSPPPAPCAAAVDAAMLPQAAGGVELSAPLAAVIAGRRHSSSNGFGLRHAKSAVDLSVCSLSEDISAAPAASSSSQDDSALPVPTTLAAAAGAAAAECSSSLPLQQGSTAARARGLRRSATSASLKALTESSGKLLAPLKLSSSLAMVSSLLPSLRGVVHASRAVLNTASSIKDAAFNVPLSVFEAGLIKALKPPMYKPVGQQWILSATGLVPQQHPIYTYPKHVSDVFWHKDLALLAFKEHSIMFYKARLLQQARRR